MIDSTINHNQAIGAAGSHGGNGGAGLGGGLGNALGGTLTVTSTTVDHNKAIGGAGRHGGNGGSGLGGGLYNDASSTLTLPAPRSNTTSPSAAPVAVVAARVMASAAGSTPTPSGRSLTTPSPSSRRTTPLPATTISSTEGAGLDPGLGARPPRPRRWWSGRATRGEPLSWLALIGEEDDEPANRIDCCSLPRFQYNDRGSGPYSAVSSRSEARATPSTGVVIPSAPTPPAAEPGALGIVRCGDDRQSGPRLLLMSSFTMKSTPGTTAPGYSTMATSCSSHRVDSFPRGPVRGLPPALTGPPVPIP